MPKSKRGRLQHKKPVSGGRDRAGGHSAQYHRAEEQRAAARLSPPLNRPARVVVFYCGGTIGMLPGDRDDPQSPLAPAALEELAPALADFNPDIDISLQPLRDSDGAPLPPLVSADIGWEKWVLLAENIVRVYDDCDGIIVLHGTDTMAYTASALSFLLGELGKPVVVTGSQIPLLFEDSDADLNVSCALMLAGAAGEGLPVIAEVTICFDELVLRANRTTKVSSQKLAAFASPMYESLATFGKVFELSCDSKAPQTAAPPVLSPLLHNAPPQVALVQLYPGMGARQLETVLGDTDLQGVVLRTYGAGNAPTAADMLDVVERCVARGVVVVNVSQCPHGGVDMNLYASGNALARRGVLSGRDLTTEAAFTKLSWLLATAPRAEVERLFALDARGEGGTMPAAETELPSG